MSNCTVYIDEAGDLGFQRGTQWFVLTAVIVDKCDEKSIRNHMSQIKTKFNLRDIHFRKLPDFNKRIYIVKELSINNFTYVNVITDTTKLNLATASTSSVAYNYICRLLLERVSWFLRDTRRVADIILSARGTSRDNELIDYIKNKLLTYDKNQIVSEVFEKITAKSASEWELLQLADVCATTMFNAYEINNLGFCSPCFSMLLNNHLYAHNGEIKSYGVKYFALNMKPNIKELKQNWPCIKKERTLGTTTT